MERIEEKPGWMDGWVDSQLARQTGELGKERKLGESNISRASMVAQR